MNLSKSIKAVVFTMLIIIIAGCSRIPVPYYTDIGYAPLRGEIKYMYLLTTDEYASNKKIKSLLNNHLKYNLHKYYKAEVQIIEDKSEIIDKESLLFLVNITDAVDGKTNNLIVDLECYNNRNNKAVFKYEGIQRRLMGWNRVTKKMATTIIVLSNRALWP